jgi:hypothetical protein
MVGIHSFAMFDSISKIAASFSLHSAIRAAILADSSETSPVMCAGKSTNAMPF